MIGPLEAFLFQKVYVLSRHSRIIRDLSYIPLTLNEVHLHLLLISTALQRLYHAGKSGKASQGKEGKMRRPTGVGFAKPSASKRRPRQIAPPSKSIPFAWYPHLWAIALQN